MENLIQARQCSKHVGHISEQQRLDTETQSLRAYIPDWVLAFGVAEKSKANLISGPLYVTFSLSAGGIFLFQVFKKFIVLCLVWIYFHPFCWVLGGLICSADSCPSVLDISLAQSVDDFLLWCSDAGPLYQGGTFLSPVLLRFILLLFLGGFLSFNFQPF